MYCLYVLEIFNSSKGYYYWSSCNVKSTKEGSSHLRHSFRERMHRWWPASSSRWHGSLREYFRRRLVAQGVSVHRYHQNPCKRIQGELKHRHAKGTTSSHDVSVRRTIITFVNRGYLSQTYSCSRQYSYPSNQLTRSCQPC